DREPKHRVAFQPGRAPTHRFGHDPRSRPKVAGPLPEDCCRPVTLTGSSQMSAVRRICPASRSPIPDCCSLGCGLLLVRPQDQLLHPPGQNLGDVEFVLGWARDLVNPPELLELLARLAEITEHLSIQAECGDAAGIGIGAVEYLVRPRRDA